MITRFFEILIILSIVLCSLSGCSVTNSDSGVSEKQAVDSGADETIHTEDNDSRIPDTTGTTPEELAEPEIPEGSIALFATLSGGTQSSFLRVEGGNVNWDTTHYKLLRYIPEVNLLHEFGWTSSKSYSKSFIYGITQDGWFYEVKCFTDSGRKDITRKDPKTGQTIGSFGSITTSDMYGGFTICGDRLIYRTTISKDLMGNRKSGGNVMVMKFGGTTASQVLDYYDENNMGRYLGIGSELITIVTTYEDSATFYDIYSVNPATMALGELLYSFGSEDYVEFFTGETSLFWSEVIPGSEGVYIVKFTLSESPVYFLELTETDPLLLSVDESNGKVLVTFKDNTPESPFYYLADMHTDEIEELDIEPAFFSTLINGNGQFLIIE
ncbi:MAG: hypothetical protein JSU79_02570 [Dehalococcoidales bacterium]|nr:MAG: hypothetical protein JSU79_02570 [Dehalococcoidales bacterium]